MRRLVLIGLLAFATPALADDFTTDLNVAHAPFNVVNLFMSSGTFSGTTTGMSVPAAPWNAYVNTGSFLQLTTGVGGSTSLFLNFSQDFLGVPPAGTTLSYQAFNWNGASIVGAPLWGGLTLSSSSGSLNLVSGFTAGYAGPTIAGGAPNFIAPVPEPSCVLVCGVGLGLLGVRAWRRGRHSPCVGALPDAA